ncbi:MAG: type VI secretion system baseplate subunit TssG [Campylobacter sp.]|nr:type VI secretion system baseplate subunit TssG [Campylobacter sp.]
MKLQYSNFYRVTKRALNKYTSDNIIFRDEASLSHPVKEIRNGKVIHSPNGKYLEFLVNFMGLYGTSSLLPSYLLDKFRKSNSDEWKAFFDFFNNYLLWIFFEIVSSKTYPRSFKGDFSDRISIILFKILGLTDKETAKTYLPFAPLLVSARRPKIYIEQILRQNFNLQGRLSIIENIPHYINIPKTQQSKIGLENTNVGQNLILGEKTISHQSKIMIYIKDLNYNEASDYFPGATNFDKLKNAFMFLSNAEFAADVCLDINYSDNMRLKLGSQTHSKLGFASILSHNTKKSYKLKFGLCD